jgi:hypothetical protein
VVHESGGVGARAFRREAHAGGDRGVRRHAIQVPQLIRAQSEEIVEAGVGAPQVEQRVERTLVAQDPRGERVGESPVPLRHAR